MLVGICAPDTSSPTSLNGAFATCGLATAPTEPCQNGGVCVPAIGGVFSDVCVLVAAGDPCPNGYPNEQSASEVTGDDRDCECDCGSSSTACAGAQLTVY